MFELVESKTFVRWLTRLRDPGAKALIVSRLDRLSKGHWGDVRDVGKGVLELRLHFGPGYRVYVLRHGAVFVILLCAGTKATQARDILLAQKIAEEWKAGHV